MKTIPPGAGCPGFWFLALTLVASCAGSAPTPHAGFLDAPVAEVASEVSGRVDSIPVREGDTVKKGQVLAQLDAREKQATVNEEQSALTQATESLGEARANFGAMVPTVKGAGADIAQAQATYDDAETNYNRIKKLRESGASTDADLSSARARMLEAKAHIDSLSAARTATKGRVRASMVGVGGARAALATADAALQLAQVQLAEAQVLSPFDGLVVNRNLQPGEWAAPGTPVVTVEDLSQLWVRLDIEETELNGLQLGQNARVHVMAVPGSSYRGHIIEIGAEGDFAVNRDVKRGRPDIRTFRVRVALDESAAALRPGMTAEVTFEPGGVPVASLLPRDGGQAGP